MNGRYTDYGLPATNHSTGGLTMMRMPWGMLFRSDVQWGRRAALVEMICLLAGIAMAFGVTWQWIALGNQGADFAMRFSAAALQLAAAILFIWVSERGLGREVHVDVVDGDLRQYARNRRGALRAIRVIPLADVRTAFVKRSPQPGKPAQMYARIGTSNREVPIAEGGEPALRRIQECMRDYIVPELAAA